MIRSIEQWRGMVPEVVHDGSAAQILHCIRDAREDILSLYSSSWTGANAILNWRQKYEDGVVSADCAMEGILDAAQSILEAHDVK